jgi:hypothetical protein
MSAKGTISDSGSYGPETLKEIQKIFDGAWLGIEKSVFPWDVHAAREKLAILVFQQVSKSDGDVECIKRGVLEPIRRSRTVLTSLNIS